jgi:hypothetical protein
MLDKKVKKTVDLKLKLLDNGKTLFIHLFL